MSKYERINKVDNPENKEDDLENKDVPINNQSLLDDEEVRRRIQEELSQDGNGDKKSIFELFGSGVKTFSESLKKAIKNEDVL